MLSALDPASPIGGETGRGFLRDDARSISSLDGRRIGGALEAYGCAAERPPAPRRPSAARRGDLPVRRPCSAAA